MRIAILGMGSWGTALALLLSHKGFDTVLWGRDGRLLEKVRQERENSRYLPGQQLPDNVTTAKTILEATCDADGIVLAVPSGAARETARLLAESRANPALLINAGKGLEEQTGLRISEILAQELPKSLADRAVSLSGPNLAVELANGVPTATVVASKSAEMASAAQDLFSTPTFRVYTNPDLTGVELAGALKNVFAIGAGISDGLGYGDNTKATLLTRGLAEMTRLGIALGADRRTFLGLAGVGDLMATSASSLSRNLRLGRGLGSGLSVSDALTAVAQVAEGMPTCRAAYELSKRVGVDMPITEQIYNVLFQGKSPHQAVQDLMRRELKEEYA